ncbi:MAG: PilZ domain-containing protein [gamma proteobacterium symbiont of Ctena orbiculata]|nr:PilZ domain-containing protein [Candidatus Thiodiazotropha taylori]MBT3060876.1 PilZ domain-containing protein [Candidatus Thiodiazotropha sp. (ex Lucina pensylvanica)]MBT3064261.1 PilZ domain-containing protein [Candidatus Thiodiazotropha sp. (ex Lucina pensylvanica)]MBV2093888.1 PilZ domain-containing protein [Candidatus Thiodiazotropha sp. (ex Codakia orbicularis)]
MDARKSPRTKTSLTVTIASETADIEQIRTIKDLSESGFYVDSLTKSKIDEGYLVYIKKPGQKEGLRLPARVIRVDHQGCGLTFDRLAPNESQFLCDLIHPKWDGKDLLTGIVMHGVLEDTTEFAACMRLTSLLSSRYRTIYQAR